MIAKRSRSLPVAGTFDFNIFSMVMVQTVLVLMIILMLLSAPVHRGADVYLPHAQYPASMPRASREGAMVIAVTRDGKVYFHSAKTPPEELPALVRKDVAGGAERKVYLRIDRYAHYALVDQVLSQIGASGVPKVSFLVEKTLPPSVNSR